MNHWAGLLPFALGLFIGYLHGTENARFRTRKYLRGFTIVPKEIWALALEQAPHMRAALERAAKRDLNPKLTHHLLGKDL